MFLAPITERSKAKQKQTWITFDTELEIAQYQDNLILSHRVVGNSTISHDVLTL